MTASPIETGGVHQGEGLEAFLAAREFLFTLREDYETAYRDFRWPQLNKFNWALDYFDTFARGNNKPALWIVDENGPEVKLSFAEMSLRSNQVANFLRQQGVRRGDRLIVQLPNLVAIGKSCSRLSNWAPSLSPLPRCLPSAICATASIAAKLGT